MTVTTRRSARLAAKVLSTTPNKEATGTKKTTSKRGLGPSKAELGPAFKTTGLKDVTNQPLKQRLRPRKRKVSKNEQELLKKPTDNKKSTKDRVASTNHSKSRNSGKALRRRESSSIDDSAPAPYLIPDPPTSGKKPSISFSPNKSYRLIEPLSKWTPDEVRATWYKKEELKTRHPTEELTGRLPTKEERETGFARGLEHICPVHRNCAIKSVLDEQARQRVFKQEHVRRFGQTLTPRELQDLSRKLALVCLPTSIFAAKRALELAAWDSTVVAQADGDAVPVMTPGLAMVTEVCPQNMVAAETPGPRKLHNKRCKNLNDGSSDIDGNIVGSALLDSSVEWSDAERETVRQTLLKLKETERERREKVMTMEKQLLKLKEQMETERQDKVTATEKNIDGSNA